MHVEDTQSASNPADWQERTRSPQLTMVEHAVVAGKHPAVASSSAGHICG